MKEFKPKFSPHNSQSVKTVSEGGGRVGPILAASSAKKVKHFYQNTFTK